MTCIQYPTNYVVWDFETSGLDPKTDLPIELGYIEVRNGEIHSQRSLLLKHPDLKLSEKITEITGITDAMLDGDGVNPFVAIADFMEIMLLDIPHITHNGIRFDIPFLFEYLSRNPAIMAPYPTQAKAMIERNTIDTAVLFKAAKLDMPRRFNETFTEWGRRVLDVRAFGLKYNVGACCNELGIPVTTQHRALGDVLLTNEIYKKLV